MFIPFCHSRDEMILVAQLPLRLAKSFYLPWEAPSSSSSSVRSMTPPELPPATFPLWKTKLFHFAKANPGNTGEKGIQTEHWQGEVSELINLLERKWLNEQEEEISGKFPRTSKTASNQWLYCSIKYLSIFSFVRSKETWWPVAYCYFTDK